MRQTLTVDGRTCGVEPLSRAGMSHYERTNSPIAQVNAPQGYVFSGGETAILVHSAADFEIIARDETLVEADEEKLCKAFLQCENIATTSIYNVMKGLVRACERCARRLAPPVNNMGQQGHDEQMAHNLAVWNAHDDQMAAFGRVLLAINKAGDEEDFESMRDAQIGSLERSVVQQMRARIERNIRAPMTCWRTY